MEYSDLKLMFPHLIDKIENEVSNDFQSRERVGQLNLLKWDNDLELTISVQYFIVDENGNKYYDLILADTTLDERVRKSRLEQFTTEIVDSTKGLYFDLTNPSARAVKAQNLTEEQKLTHVPLKFEFQLMKVSDIYPETLNTVQGNKFVFKTYILPIIEQTIKKIANNLS